METINNDNHYYLCEQCKSHDVEIDNSCGCAIVDLKCNKCGHESMMFREDISLEIDSDTDKLLIDSIKDPTVIEGFREIIDSFVDNEIITDGFLSDDQRNTLMEDLMDMMNNHYKENGNEEN